MSELLKQADLAMYQAKAAGRNTLRFFDPQMQAVVTARAALETDLRAAWRKTSFLHFQPQVRQSGAIAGVEALLRWKPRQRGMVSPSDFIALAEETGLIVPLGRWVLHPRLQAAGQLAGRPPAPRPDHGRERQLQPVPQPQLCGRRGARAGHHRGAFRPAQAGTDRKRAGGRHGKHHRHHGSPARLWRGFSLDDFGTGYSSLSYLKRMPLDQLKIDQSFVRDVLSDPNDAAIVHTIIGLSRSLGLDVIAEG